MWTPLFVLGTAIALSLGSFLTPNVLNAQPTPKDCTAGEGLYSCEFKDEAGGIQSGSLDLFLNQNSSAGFFSANVNGAEFFGRCACGLQGSTKNNKPLKDNKAIVCAGDGVNSQAALAGKVAGNPNKPQTLRAYGQLQLFPFNSTIGSSPGYLFNCTVSPL